MNQDQLATVIGHEVAHVLADPQQRTFVPITDHGVRFIDYECCFGFIYYKKQYQGMTMAALGLGVQYGVILPYGRTQV